MVFTLIIYIMQQKDLLRNIKLRNVSTAATMTTELKSASDIRDAVNAVRNTTSKNAKVLPFNAFNAKVHTKHGTHNARRESQRKID